MPPFHLWSQKTSRKLGFKIVYHFCLGEARGDDDRGADVREDPGSEHPGGVPHNPGRHEDTRAARVQGKQTQVALVKVNNFS